MNGSTHRNSCGFVRTVLIVGLLATGAHSATLLVPAQYPTIQAALDAAANTGDEVVVAPGTYPEAINFHGKAVYLHSSDGSAVTTINATELNTSVVTCASGEGPDTVLDGFTITGGSAGYHGGGGMSNTYGSSPTVINCVFSANSAWYGGGMYNHYSSPTVTNCTFSGNLAYWGAGGGMCNEYRSPTVSNCTFSGNSGIFGGGIVGSASVTNCILWGDTPDEIEEASVAYSDVQGGYAGAANIDADPLFVDPTNGNFRLAASSPCIDAGTNAAVASGSDADGHCRVMDGNGSGSRIVDMGPYEAPGPVLDCNENGLCDCQEAAAGQVPDCNHNFIPDSCDIAAGTSPDCNHNGVPDECDIANGTSWDCNHNSIPDECDIANGTSLDVFPPGGDGIPDDCERVRNITQHLYYGRIQPALDAAGNADDIIVAPGTYPEAINFHGKAVRLRSSDGAAATIIDATWLYTSVVTCTSGEEPGTVLEGFTITGGTGTPDDYGNTYGGGMYNVSSSPTVTNCIFSGNSAFLYGGGMYTYAGSPTVTNCTFSGNSASGLPWSSDGGGMWNDNGSNPTVSNCTFSGNSAGGWGGGICNNGSSPLVADCTFTGNSALYGGGGVANGWGSNPTVTNCTFTGNSTSGGGGMWNYASSPAVTNCVFSGNGASGSYLTGVGGGMANGGGANPTVTNCTFDGNSASGSGGGIGNYDVSSTTVTNCILWGETPDEIAGDAATVTYSDVQGGYAGTGNINADPLFVDPNNGNIRLTAGSPCIDAGDPNFVSTPGETDLDGNKRVWDGNGDSVAVVDMGAYEFGSHRYGDLNCDGAINFDDVNAFVLALSDPAGYHAAYPTCGYLLADINGDGAVTFDDIDPFVAILSGGQ
jgi:hypothetical protein